MVGSIKQIEVNMRREPLWITKIRNTITDLERWLKNIKYDKEQYELMTEFINNSRLEQESIEIQQKLMTQYDKYKTRQFDKEIKNLEESLIKWNKKYKEAIVKYRKWQINKDFEE